MKLTFNEFVRLTKERYDKGDLHTEQLREFIKSGKPSEPRPKLKPGPKPFLASHRNFTLRLEHSDRELLQKLVGVKGKNPSEVMRILIREAANELGLPDAMAS